MLEGSGRSILETFQRKGGGQRSNKKTINIKKYDD